MGMPYFANNPRQSVDADVVTDKEQEKREKGEKDDTSSGSHTTTIVLAGAADCPSNNRSHMGMGGTLSKRNNVARTETMVIVANATRWQTACRRYRRGSCARLFGTQVRRARCNWPLVCAYRQVPLHSGGRMLSQPGFNLPAGPWQRAASGGAPAAPLPPHPRDPAQPVCAGRSSSPSITCACQREATPLSRQHDFRLNRAVFY